MAMYGDGGSTIRRNLEEDITAALNEADGPLTTRHLCEILAEDYSAIAHNCEQMMYGGLVRITDVDEDDDTLFVVELTE